jgi:hypothetical protein
MVSSITSAYTSMSQAQLAQQAHTAVMKQAVNVQEMQGAGVARLLQSAEQVGTPAHLQDPMLGQNVDLLA